MKKLILVMFGLLFFSVAAWAEDEVQVSNFQVLALDHSPYMTTYSLKIDVDNSGEGGEIFIHVVAKNRDGFELHNLFLRGNISNGERKSLTNTTYVKNNTASDIDQWTVDTVKIFHR